jgi:hypothetical protein
MSSRNRVVLPRFTASKFVLSKPLLSRLVLSIAALVCLSLLVACGSSSPKGTAPPTGGFSNSNLSGTYAFSTVGEDVNNGIMAIAGTFTANGSGGITGGTIDVMEPSGPVGISPALSVTGGNYSVGADGRPESSSGVITLATSSEGTFIFDYVLSSTNGGLITYFSPNAGDGGSGSGTFQLQTSVTQTSINGQPYTFSTSGTSSTASIAMAGAFTLDANGNVGVTTTGIEDVTTLSTSAIDVPCGTNGCAMSSGNITLSSTAGAPGTASFAATPGTFTFDVYPVSPSQLIFIETDGTFVTVGNAFTQATSIPVGNNVYSVAGIDLSSGSPIASVGLLVTNSTNGITNASTQDFNDGGSSPATPGTFTGSYGSLTSGRSTITLNGFVNEADLGCSNCSFAVYPFVSGGVNGMLVVENDGGGITSGVAYIQGSSPAFASGQGYGMDLTGTNISTGTEEDDIAEFTNTSGALAGLIDYDDQGTTSFGSTYTGTYAADSTGISGRGTVTTATPGTTGYGMATYVVDSSTSVAVVNDGSGMIALGTLQTQSATSASANIAQQHLAALRASIVAGKHLKKQSKNR